MSTGPAEQRNVYKGSPPHAWMRVRLVAANGGAVEVELIVDTGNPVAIILGTQAMSQFRHGICSTLNSNFGPLEGGWLRVVIPEATWIKR